MLLNILDLKVKVIQETRLHYNLILFNFSMWQIVKFKLNILVDRKTHKGL